MNLPKRQSAFLWGARKTGKTFYLKTHFPKSITYDLLNTSEYWRLLTEPDQLRLEVLSLNKQELTHPIIIDEIQLVPQLLNEVHWLIENSSAYFILCGSSARKLRRDGANMLGGRAWRYHFYPLTFTEIPNFNLLKALSHGLIPSHYTAQNWKKTITAYVEDYLTQEIKAEGLVRNLVAFSKFIKISAHSNCELINYVNIAKDCQINNNTVKEYYQILEDTLLGYFIYPFKKSKKRKDIVATPKFYYFDVGVVNGITGRTITELSGMNAGQALEHYILMELMAYKGLNDLDFDISFWRTQNGLEVDFVLANGSVAIEVKISSRIRQSELHGLLAYAEAENPKKIFVVCMAPRKQKINLNEKRVAEILPVNTFLSMLWNREII